MNTIEKEEKIQAEVERLKAIQNGPSDDLVKRFDRFDQMVNEYLDSLPTEVDAIWMLESVFVGRLGTANDWELDKAQRYCYAINALVERFNEED